MPEIGAPFISHSDIVAVLRRQQAKTDLTDEDLSLFADAQLRTQGSAARVAMASCASSAQLAITRSKILQVKTTVSLVLTAVEKKTVRATYPERDFVFNDRERHDHALAATMRKIDRSILREKLPLRANVVDIGGDYVYNLLESGCLIHSCCPTVDPKDKFRTVERMNRLRRVVADPKTSPDVRDRVRTFLADPQEQRRWVCNKLAQECDVSADAILMTHVYDMSIEDVATSLVRHKARIVHGCVILAPEMFDQVRGDLPSVNGWFELDKATDTMTYGTKGGGSWHYKHKWSRLSRFAHDCVVFVGNVPVAYRVSETRGQTLFFDVWVLENVTPLVDQPRWSYSVSGGPWAVVEGYQFAGARGSFANAAPRPVTFRYPWDTWTRAMEYARGQIANCRFTLEDFSRKMRTMTARITVNSVSVAGVDAVPEDKFADFLANCALAALYAVETERLETQILLSSVVQRREEANAWRRVLRGFLAMCAGTVQSSGAWVNNLRQAMKSAAVDSLRVVTFTKDDGSRMATVSQFPRGVDVVVPSVGESLDGAYLPTDIADLVVTACARNSDYADQMRKVLDLVQHTSGPDDTDEQKAFLEGLRAVVNAPVLGHESDDARTADVTDTRVDSQRLADPHSEEVIMAEPAPLPHANVDARTACLAMGVDDLIESDEVHVFDVDAERATQYYKAAMVEAIRLYNAEERRATSECKETFAKTTEGGRPHKHRVNLLQGDAMNPDYYDVVQGVITGSSFLGVPLALFAHAAVYLPPTQSVHRVVRTDDRVTVIGQESYTGVALVIKSLTIFNGPEIRDAIGKAIDRLDVRNFTIVVRDGVPGCGKTTQIIRGARYDDLILASGRENTIATRDKKIAMDREAVVSARSAGTLFTPFQNPRKRIRTYDSYLVSRITEKTEVLHADECFMEHSGKLIAAVVLSGARRVEFHGDTKQVPYVCRHVEELCVFSRLMYRHLHINRYVSHRCPQDAVAAIASQYDYKIRTTSKVVNSLSMSTDVPMDAVQWDVKKKYITFYQDDKATAAKRCYKGGVNTVAECQGETYPDVVLVRQQARPQELYSKWPYVLVGLSRHTKTCEFLAPSATASLFERQILAVQANEEYCRQFGDISTAGKPTNIRI